MLNKAKPGDGKPKPNQSTLGRLEVHEKRKYEKTKDKNKKIYAYVQRKRTERKTKSIAYTYLFF